MAKRLTKEEFVKKATAIHGYEYDYSDSIIIKSSVKTKIKHKKCGTVFEMTPNNHTNKTHPQGCPICNGNLKPNNNDFIEKSNAIHNKKYDYSKTNYVNARTKICVICHEKDDNGIEHGEFFITPNNHLMGRGCPKCKSKRLKECNQISKKDFFEKCKKKYGNKFIYDEDSFTDMNSKFRYICKKHGEMIETCKFHLYSKNGCRKCAEDAINSPKKSAEIFKKELSTKYGDLYTFNINDYAGMNKKIKFLCKKHGEFIESPTNLKRGCKCKKCSSLYTLEKEISDLLTKNEINFEFQKKAKWLGRLSLDFYIPKYNIAIECQGRQHYETVCDFGGKNCFDEQIKRDQRKKMLCEQNGIELLYFTHYNNVNENNVTFKDKEKLLYKIKSYELQQQQT